MRQAARTARYDQALGLEGYSLRAVDRPFPSSLPPASGSRFTAF